MHGSDLRKIVCMVQTERRKNMSRVPDQNGISQACYRIEIYHSGPETSMCAWFRLKEERSCVHDSD